MTFKYLYYKQLAQSTGLNLLTADIRAVLVTGAYSADSHHQFLSSVGVGARMGVTGALGSKSVTDGVFHANPGSIEDVAPGIAQGVILYNHTGDEATSVLISYHAVLVNITETSDVVVEGEDGDRWFS